MATPTLDSCINSQFAVGAFGSSSGSVTIDEYTSYLLTIEGDRIILTTTTPPPGAPVGESSYDYGFALLSG
jgi:hypothetical protein